MRILEAVVRLIPVMENTQTRRVVDETYLTTMQPVSENSGLNLTKPQTVYGMDLINGAHLANQPAFPGQPYGGNKITYEQVDPSTFDDEESDEDIHGSLPKPGKKTKGRVKIKMEFIENKLRRYTTFSKRKTGIMKKAYELSTLTGTQVMLLVASETGHVYTFATRKLQPMITSESGKALIQTCLNSPDPPPVAPGQQSAVEQRMNPTGFEETELTYAVEEETKMMGIEGSNGNIKPLFAITNNSNGEQTYVQSQPPTVNISNQPQVQTQSLQPSLPRPANTPTPSSQIAQTTATKTTAANNGIAVQLSQALPHGFIIQPAGTSITIPVQNPAPQQQTVSSNPQTIYRIPQPHQMIANPPVLQQADTGQQQISASASQTQTAVNMVAAAPQAASAMTPSVFMYSTPQGIVYAPATASVQDKQIFNFQQIPLSQPMDTGGQQQQIIAIPVPVSMTGSQQIVQIAQSDTGQAMESQAPVAKKPRN